MMVNELFGEGKRFLLTFSGSGVNTPSAVGACQHPLSLPTWLGLPVSASSFRFLCVHVVVMVMLLGARDLKTALKSSP